MISQDLGVATKGTKRGGEGARGFFCGVRNRSCGCGTPMGKMSGLPATARSRRPRAPQLYMLDSWHHRCFLSSSAPVFPNRWAFAIIGATSTLADFGHPETGVDASGSNRYGPVNMPTTIPTNLLAIGLTGSFGSGCSYTAENVLSKRGFRVASLSSALKDEYKAQKGRSPDGATRRELQDFGDHLRETKGEEYLAEMVCRRIASECECDRNTPWVIDSIRNPKEVYYLRENCHRFFLFGIYAEKETRWRRVKDKYNRNQKEFDEDDARDTGRDSLKSGQRVADCFTEADVVIPNNDHIDSTQSDDFQKFDGRVGQYIDLLRNPLAHQRPISPKEAIMATAYAVSQQSSCLKRKVGAVIVDSAGNIIASGFNEVPSYGRPCDGRHGKCFRDLAWDKFFPQLKELLPEAEAKQGAVKHLFRSKFKILDYCQSLHAEENAIVNLARNGRSVPMEQCRLYTTTYPCRLCANKIVNLGIKHVVYLEPYPDEEAKIILNHAAVEDEFFEGVTFRAYFRLYGDTQ